MEREDKMDIVNTGITLRQIIRLRPLAVSVLEKESAFRFWDRLDEPLDAFCRNHGLDADPLRERIFALKPAPSDTDWTMKPLYVLIDRLTENHRAFREEVMPAIEAMLVEPDLPAYPDGYVIKLLLQEFRYFRQEFLKHMDEEESFLFPKIMRNEACFRHPKLGPQVYKGSVNLFLKLETHKPEAEFKRMFTSIRDKLRNQPLQPSSAALARNVEDALESFEARLFEHADLETEVLFPLAGRLEQELYESSAPGLSRFPGNQ
jgi:iron-sulfur cluster repair protein YtfE (RIC family)